MKLDSEDVHAIASAVADELSRRLAGIAATQNRPAFAAGAQPPIQTTAGTITPPKVVRLAYTAAETCQAFGIGKVTLWRLEKRGLIQSIPGIRHRLYSVEAVNRFLEGRVKLQ